MDENTRNGAHARDAIVFEVGNRRIEVRRTPRGRFRVSIQATDWTITKTNLLEETAVAFILRGARGRRSTLIQHPKLVRASILLEEGVAKTTGVNWMALRMAGGSRPIILKAPALFRQCLLHIEPVPNQEARYFMRIIDPFTERRTTPIEVDQGQVEQAMRTFGST